MSNKIQKLQNEQLLNSYKNTIKFESNAYMWSTFISLDLGFSKIPNVSLRYLLLFTTLIFIKNIYQNQQFIDG